MITTLATTVGYTTNFDAVADQSWLGYDPSGTGTTNEAKDSFVSFDSPTSIAKKGVDMSPTQAGVGGSLGGAFIFELSGDYAATATAAQQHPLLNAANGMKMLLPGLVTNLTSSASGTTATLSWTTAPGSASYNVYSETGAGAGAGALIANVTTTGTSISNLTAGKQYWYLVAGKNAFGQGVSAETSVTVPGGPITPIITWPAPHSIYYGTTLSATQLNATASVAGNFVYTPPAGTVLLAGANTLAVTFTPSVVGYKSATATVSINVSAVPSYVTWPTPASIPYGTPLSAVQLDATASVAGTFVYTPAKGAVLPVGTDTLSVTFTPSNPNYKGTTGSVSIVVTAATLSTSTGFGSSNIGRTGNAHAITLTFRALIPAPTVQVLTLGANGLDFQNAGASCVVQNLLDRTVCTVLVTFTPTAVGQRMGAVILQYGGNTIATAYISGVGFGPQLAFDPGTPSAVSFAFQTSPNGVAVDGAGNTYFADYHNNEVWKITPAGTYSAYVTGLSGAPYALALDGAGNLFMSVSNTIIKVTPAGVKSTIGSGWYAVPKGITVDASGNVYVANTLGNTVVKVAVDGTQTTVLSGTVLSKPLNLPTGVAIDGLGNLYVVDWGNSRILKYISGTTSVVTVGVGSPNYIAVSDTGNLYIADPGNNRIVKLNPAGVQSTVLSGTILGASFPSLSGIAVDGSENLYLSDFSHQRLVRIKRATPPSLSFASTKVGLTSSDSPQTITVENVGNATLTFPAPSSGTNSSLSANFTYGAATTCPEIKVGGVSGTLNSGSSCNYAINFVPASAGSVSGSLTLTDNALDGANVKQTIALSGTGTAGTAAAVTLGGLSATYTGAPIAARATTVPAGLAVSFTYNGSATAPAKAGSYTVIGTVTAPGYSGSASGTLVISKATPVITWATPAPITYGTTLSTTQLDATANVAGTSFVYTPAAGSTPAVGTDTLSLLFTPTDTTDYNTASGKVSLVVNAATAPLRVVWIPDFYSGLVQVRIGAGTSITAITVSLPTCNPNSVAVNSNKLYVACSYDQWQNTNPDKILVYNAATIRSAAAGTLSINPTQTISSAQFSSLVGIAFDGSNNLWVTSNGNNQVDMISAATLNTATPSVTASLVNSPNAPAGLAFAPDGSLWVTGLDGSGTVNSGILLNFQPSQFGLGGGATPSYCMASESGQGCQYVAGLFMNDPEGVALVNGDIWVADNSGGAAGTTPGRELIDLKVSTAAAATAMGTLTVNATFGNTAVAADSPFVCPGGLFSTSTHLWVNDESYGETNPQCGGNGDVAGKTGGVFSFTPAQLTAKTTTASLVLSFSNVTGRPGFGGIFVENDQ
jgi:sugar lactone lactonase YvrE